MEEGILQDGADEGELKKSTYAPEASFGDGASSWWDGKQRKEEKNKERIGCKKY
jgi:hypothetical protein